MEKEARTVFTWIMSGNTNYGKEDNMWNFDWEKAKKVAKNALIFLAPVVIIELTLLQQGVTEFREYQIAFQVWGLGIALDFFRKLKAS
jgi:hypothetical protein